MMAKFIRLNGKIYKEVGARRIFVDADGEPDVAKMREGIKAFVRDTKEDMQYFASECEEGMSLGECIDKIMTSIMVSSYDGIVTHPDYSKYFKKA